MKKLLGLIAAAAVALSAGSALADGHLVRIGTEGAYPPFNYIDDNGYVYVRKLGGTNPAITKAQRLTIHTRKGPVKGVVGSVAPHLMKGDSGKGGAPQIQDLFIDIGVSSRKAAEKLISVGLSRPPGRLSHNELAGWANVALALLNLSEAITRN